MIQVEAENEDDVLRPTTNVFMEAETVSWNRGRVYKLDPPARVRPGETGNRKARRTAEAKRRKARRQ